MATTRESFEDALRWFAGMLRKGVRWSAIVGVFALAFAALVVVTTRETFSDCGDVNDRQRELLATLLAEDPDRSFRAERQASCEQGVFSEPITGVAATMDAATHQLEADGWVVETNYIAYSVQLWRRCFRSDEPGWESVQITVDASRDGAVSTVAATAPENVAACDLERRDQSDIYPP